MLPALALENKETERWGCVTVVTMPLLRAVRCSAVLIIIDGNSGLLGCVPHWSHLVCRRWASFLTAVSEFEPRQQGTVTAIDIADAIDIDITVSFRGTGTRHASSRMHRASGALWQTSSWSCLQCSLACASAQVKQATSGCCSCKLIGRRSIVGK